MYRIYNEYEFEETTNTIKKAIIIAKKNNAYIRKICKNGLNNTAVNPISCWNSYAPPPNKQYFWSSTCKPWCKSD